MTEREIFEGFICHEENPRVLGVKRMGKSQTIIVTFEQEEVPRRLIFYNGFTRCQIFKTRYEVCYRCGELGHRSDVCSSLEKRCRGCGLASPQEDHRCTARCHICGKEHVTGDKNCKELFRTPFVVRKRQWEARRTREQEQAAKQQPQTIKHQHQGRPTVRERAGSRNRSQSESGTRERSVSFPRLQETTERRQQNSHEETKTRPAQQVGWAGRVSQDSETVKALKEQNKMLNDQLMQSQRAMKEQNESFQKQLLEVQRQMREQGEAYQKQMLEMSQRTASKGANETGQANSGAGATSSVAPPLKKKRAKEIEPKNTIDHRQDKLEEDIKIIQNLIMAMQRENATRQDKVEENLKTMQNLIMEMQRDNAKRGQQLDWMSMELDKQANGRGQ